MWKRARVSVRADSRASSGDGTGEPARVHLERVLRFRLAWLGVFLSVGFVALGGRLWSIQVEDHEAYRKSATRMHTRREPLPAYRGDILTRDRVLLAREEFRHDIGVDPTRIPADKLRATVGAICQALELPASRRRERESLAESRGLAGGQYVSLAKNVDSDARADVLRAARTVLDDTGVRRGVVINTRSHRSYPRGTFAAQIVGVTDHTGSGAEGEGLERALDDQLRPTAGVREVQVSGASTGPRFFRPGSALVEPLSGWNVVTTIDSRVQTIVEQQLEWCVKLRNAESGVCVVLDCRTGEVLAMASYPWYDPAQYAKYPGQERERRRRNRVIEEGYELGSVIKPFIMAAILEHGLVGLDQRIMGLLPAGVSWNGGARAYMGSRPVTDVHGRSDMTVASALYGSSNIGMSVLGLRLGKERLADTLERFGFGRPTGILLPAEDPGFYDPPAKWGRFQQPVSISFGYAIRVTPIQLARAFAAIVNGGRLLRPRIVARVERDGEVHRFVGDRVVPQVIRPETSAKLRELLHQVVKNEHGTARYLAVDGFEFGGKTGTAKIAGRGGYAADYTASFEAFAPYEDPEVVVVCQIRRPRGKHYGGSVAGPVVVQVLRQMYGIEKQCLLARMTSGWNWVGP